MYTRVCIYIYIYIYIHNIIVYIYIYIYIYIYTIIWECSGGGRVPEPEERRKGAVVRRRDGWDTEASAKGGGSFGRRRREGRESSRPLARRRRASRLRTGWPRATSSSRRGPRAPRAAARLPPRGGGLSSAINRAGNFRRDSSFHNSFVVCQSNSLSLCVLMIRLAMGGLRPEGTKGVPRNGGRE